MVLDEVGLAEDSPKMPLKTLHPLLEDGDQIDDEIIQTEDSFTRVAFIGLSNWALDPAKMNRGIMLCRNEPDDDELEATARYLIVQWTLNDRVQLFKEWITLSTR